MPRDDFGMVIGPRSATECAVTALWADVMGYQPQSIDDTFESTGGDESRAARLLALIYDRWRVQITPTEFWACSSIAGISGTVDRKIVENRTRESALLSAALDDLDGWRAAEVWGPGPA